MYTKVTFIGFKTNYSIKSFTTEQGVHMENVLWSVIFSWLHQNQAWHWSMKMQIFQKK